MLLVKKCQFFHYLFSLKITLEIGFNIVLKRKEPFFTVKRRLEIRFNNVLDTKEPFSGYKRKISESPKNRIFPKWLTHTFGQKMPNFYLFKFGQNKT